MKTIAIGAILFMTAITASGETFRVCEVLRNLSALQGKTISVEGVWVPSHAAGEYLLSEARCKEATIRDGWRFWDAIQLVDQQGRSRGKFYGRQAGKGKPLKTIGTFTGRLETQDHFEVRKQPYGENVPLAFGYSAARLVLIGQPKEVVQVPWKEEETRDWQERWKNPYPTRSSSR